MISKKKKKAVPQGRLGKGEIISIIAEKTGASKRDTAELVTAYVETVREALLQGRTVGIHELGSFSIKKTKSRNAKSRETGEQVVIPEGTKVRFTVSNILKSDLES